MATEHPLALVFRVAMEKLGGCDAEEKEGPSCAADSPRASDTGQPADQGAIWALDVGEEGPDPGQGEVRRLLCKWVS